MDIQANANGTYTATFTVREMRTLRNRTKVGSTYGQTCAAINQALNSVEVVEPVSKPKITCVAVRVGELEEGDTFIHAGQPFEVSALDSHHCEGNSVVIFDPAGNATEYELDAVVTKLV